MRAKPSHGFIWLLLMGLVALTLAAARVPNPHAMNALVFAAAAAQALLILRFYMHLHGEPWFITGFLVLALFCLGVLFVALLPDVVWRDGWVRP